LNLGKESISYNFDFKWQGKILVATNAEKEGKLLKDKIAIDGCEGYVLKITV